MVMGLIDKLQPYLGTETILVVDSEEHWLEIYSLLAYKKTFYEEKKMQRELAFNLNNFVRNFNWSTKEYYIQRSSYKNYKFIHTSELIKPNDWWW